MQPRTGQTCSCEVSDIRPLGARALVTPEGMDHRPGRFDGLMLGRQLNQTKRRRACSGRNRTPPATWAGCSPLLQCRQSSHRLETAALGVKRQCALAPKAAGAPEPGRPRHYLCRSVTVLATARAPHSAKSRPVSTPTCHRRAPRFGGSAGKRATRPPSRGKGASGRATAFAFQAAPARAIGMARQGDHANPAGRSRSSRSRSPSRRALRADASFAQRTINRETPRVGRELEAGEPGRNTSAPRREGRASTGRWTPQGRPARPARRPAHEQGT